MGVSDGHRTTWIHLQRTRQILEKLPCNTILKACPHFAALGIAEVSVEQHPVFSPDTGFVVKAEMRFYLNDHKRGFGPRLKYKTIFAESNTSDVYVIESSGVSIASSYLLCQHMVEPRPVVLVHQSIVKYT